MSSLKTNSVQIGQSVSATNNFTIYQPTVPDGTVRIGNGNIGAVTDRITINSSGFVTISNGISADGVGVFSGNVSGVNGTFSGAVSGTNGTFSGNVQMASANGFQLAGLRNRLINGQTYIQQRGQISATATVAYSADRWNVGIIGATGITATSNIGGLSGSPTGSGLYISGTWTTGIPYYAQRIESANIRDIIGEAITISGYINQPSGVNDTWNVVVSFPNLKDNFTNSTVISSNTTQTITGGSTVFFSTTFSANTMNQSNIANGLTIEIYKTNAITHGTTANYVLSAVQLERGTVATPFEQRPIGMELALCQRYYYRETNAINGAFGQGYNISTTQMRVLVKFPTTMRVVPSAVEQSGTAAHYQIRHSTVTACSAVPSFSSVATQNVGGLLATVASGLVAGQGAFFESSNAAAYLGWSAEL